MVQKQGNIFLITPEDCLRRSFFVGPHSFDIEPTEPFGNGMMFAMGKSVGARQIEVPPIFLPDQFCGNVEKTDCGSTDSINRMPIRAGVMVWLAGKNAAITDQVGNDAFITKDFTSLGYRGPQNDRVYVRVYPQSGSGVNHDIKLYWATQLENFYS